MYGKKRLYNSFSRGRKSSSYRYRFKARSVIRKPRNKIINKRAYYAAALRRSKRMLKYVPKYGILGYKKKSFSRY